MRTRKSKIHPQAIASLKRYKDDLRAGHTDAAEYWRGQAGAYFTANPIKLKSLWRGSGVMLYTKDMSDKNSVGIPNKHIGTVIHYLKSTGYIGIANLITLNHTSRGVVMTDYQGRRLFLTLKEKKQAIHLLSSWLKRNPKYHFKLRIVKNPFLENFAPSVVSGLGFAAAFKGVDILAKKFGHNPKRYRLSKKHK